MRQKLVFLLFALIIASCSGGNDEVEGSVNFDMPFSGPGVNVPFNVSEMIDSITFVVIDSTKLIGRITNIKYADGYYYILEGRKRIHKIDEQGHILLTLDRCGRGHGEYVSIYFFDIDPASGNIVVFDMPSDKINFYDPVTGNLVKEGQFNDAVSDIAILNSNEFLCFTEAAYQTKLCGLWRQDFDGNYLGSLFEYGDDYVFGSTTRWDLNFRHFNNGMLGLFDETEDKVYHINSEGNITSEYSFDFHHKIPKSILSGKEEVKSLMDDRVHALSAYFETDHWLYVQEQSGEKVVILFYDKRSGDYHIGGENDFTSDLRIWPSWCWSAGNRLISLFYPDSSNEASRMLFPDLDESSNPVLIIAHVN